MAWVFYRRREVLGLEHLPAEGPVILCANHVNALVDAVVVQASCPRPIHPLARSGLFRSPFLGPLLKAIQAVPIYRRRQQSDDAQDIRRSNESSFRRCYEYLGDGRILLIFPEGQSHSDPMLRPLKTGAARLALGARDRHGKMPMVIPVGLNFTRKGRFGSGLLVQIGAPVRYEATAGESIEQEARRFTSAIEQALEGVTLNMESWEDVALLRLLERFFALRRERHELRNRSLAVRFRAYQKLSETHRWLRLTYPQEVEILRSRLRGFDKLCRRYGVQDYHLNLRYRPALVLRFLLRSVAFTLLLLPLALWGGLNSALPYLATRSTSRAVARGRDQYDTAGMLFGLVYFLAFWSLQTFAVFTVWGKWMALAYALSLPLTAAIALLVGKERQRIIENVRIFLLFLRKRDLQGYLRLKREEIEIDLARMARLARQEVERIG